MTDTATIANGLTRAASFMSDNHEVASLVALAAVGSFLHGDGAKGNVLTDRSARINPDSATVQLAHTMSFAAHHIPPEQMFDMLAHVEQSPDDYITSTIETPMVIPVQAQLPPPVQDAALSL